MSRRFNDPDDTDGRALYRALADARARGDMAMTRKVKMREPADVGRPVNIHHGPIADGPDADCAKRLGKYRP